MFVVFRPLSVYYHVPSRIHLSTLPAVTTASTAAVRIKYITVIITRETSEIIFNKTRDGGAPAGVTCELIILFRVNILLLCLQWWKKKELGRYDFITRATCFFFIYVYDAYNDHLRGLTLTVYANTARNQTKMWIVQQSRIVYKGTCLIGLISKNISNL